MNQYEHENISSFVERISALRQFVEREMVERQSVVVNWSRSQLVVMLIGRSACWSHFIKQ